MKSEEAIKAKIKQAINSTYNAISYKEEKTNFISPKLAISTVRFLKLLLINFW